MSLSARDDFRATGRRVARAKTASVDLPRIPIAGRSGGSARDGVVPTQRGLRVKGDLWLFPLTPPSFSGFWPPLGSQLQRGEPLPYDRVINPSGANSTFFWGTTMTLCPYSSDELKDLHRLLKSIIDEAQQQSLNIPVDDIIENLFDLADRGERDPEKLREAILKKAA